MSIKIQHFLLYLRKTTWGKNMTLAQEVGQRLKQARKDKGLTQTQAGKEINQVQQAYVKYESGQIQLDYEKMVKLCKLFDCSADYLLGLADI